MKNNKQENIDKDTSKEHKKDAPTSIGFSIITVSDSRTINDDVSGRVIKELIQKQTHRVIHHVVVKDDKKDIKSAINKILCDKEIGIIITNGGTGIAPCDVTIEAVEPFFEKKISSFSPLFSKLSFEAIGSPALLSRATAGIAKGKAIFCLPGSPRACSLAVEKLILPEAGHIMKHLGD